MPRATAFTQMDPQALAMLAEDIADRIDNSGDYPMFDQISATDWQRVLPAALRELGIPVQPAAIRPPRQTRTRHACLDKGASLGAADDTSDVSKLVHETAAARAEAYKKAHRGFYPDVPFDAGSNSDRASVGLPGHCSVCAIMGHLTTHPELGCSDVGCNDPHDRIERHTCTPDGKARPYGRKAPIGECLRCDQLRAGATPREAHPAIQAANRKRGDEASRDQAIRDHDCKTAGCGPVCTAFQW